MNPATPGQSRNPSTTLSGGPGRFRCVHPKCPGYSVEHTRETPHPAETCAWPLKDARPVVHTISEAVHRLREIAAPLPDGVLRKAIRDAATDLDGLGWEIVADSVMGSKS